MYVIRLNLKGFNLNTKLLSYLMDGSFKVRFNCTNQHRSAIFGYPNKMIVDIIVCVSCFLHQDT